ncbi:MAG: hypothetical protein ACLFNW_10850 [Desulfobacterales bacterium]
MASNCTVGGYSWKKQSTKISKKRIQKNRESFREFLTETEFPDPERLGERGPTFMYPEWLIMFIAVLSVKFKLKSYVKIHQMVTQYWDIIAEDLELKPISERQLRDRLKKICHHPRKPAVFIFQLFPELV